MNQPLIHEDVLRSFLARNSFRADKTLGQNFLICEEVLDATLAALEKSPQYITELGSGVGTLTQGLIATGYTVRAIEKDNDFVKTLPGIVPPKLRSNLTVIHGDLLEEPWDWAFKPYSIVGNIPYNITGLIMRKLTSLPIPPNRAIFLVQEEVAQRLTQANTDMSLLGLSTALWGTATLLLRVPSSCFLPAPAVQSALILLEPFPTMRPLAERERIIAGAKPFFQAKRKKISTTLKRAFQKTDDQIDELMKSVDLSRDARPETISAEKWAALCAIL